MIVPHRYNMRMKRVVQLVFRVLKVHQTNLLEGVCFSRHCGEILLTAAVAEVKGE